MWRGDAGLVSQRACWTIPEGLDVCRQVCRGGPGRREMPAQLTTAYGIPAECDPAHLGLLFRRLSHSSGMP